MDLEIFGRMMRCFLAGLAVHAAMYPGNIPRQCIPESSDLELEYVTLSLVYPIVSLSTESRLLTSRNFYVHLLNC